MSDAPENIWRWDVYASGRLLEYSELPVTSENSTEYTRSDVAQERIAKLEAALMSLQKSAQTKPHFAGETPREYHMHAAICVAIAALEAKP